MARTGWQFDSYTWAVNPEKDSGWVYEHAMSENLPIGASNSSLQFSAIKSGRRQISGWIWGPNAQDQYNRMRAWQLGLTTSNLIDHRGESKKAIMIKFEPELVQSVSEWQAGRQTWRYNAEFIIVP